MTSPVQTTFNVANNTPGTLTLTFTNNIGAGNSVVVCWSSNNANPGTQTVTPGSGGDTYSSLVSDAGTFTQIYAVLPSAGGYKTVIISDAAAGYILGWAYEVPGTAILDKTSAGTTGAPGAFTSGATATTTKPSEFWVGTGFGLNTSSSAVTAIGPSGSWTNLTAQQGSSGTQRAGGVSGYQFTSATGAATYSGTTTGGTTSFAGASVATFKLPSLISSQFQRRQAVMRASVY